MLKYIFFLLLILVLILCLTTYETFDNNIIYQDDIPDMNWSKYWNDFDFKARKNANCKPIKKDYTTLGTMGTWILTMPLSCENGMPHTRAGNVIAMPENFNKNFYAKTLEHEKIHLSQRNDFSNWKKFYQKYWNYEVYENPPSSMPSNLIKMKRANPDTCWAPYCCWNKIWWSIPVYKSEIDLNFQSCPVKWWNQKENKIYDNPPNEWISFFGTKVSQSEHPNEISAVYIANQNTNSKGFKILMTKWDMSKEKLINL